MDGITKVKILYLLNMKPNYASFMEVNDVLHQLGFDYTGVAKRIAVKSPLEFWDSVKYTTCIRCGKTEKVNEHFRVVSVSGCSCLLKKEKQDCNKVGILTRLLLDTTIEVRQFTQEYLYGKQHKETTREVV